MKKLTFLFIFILIPMKYAFGNEVECNNLKKYSSEYFNCKAGNIKNKALEIGKDFVENTKEYQKKNFEESKEQLENTKEQIEKIKKK